jgi:hypothetical protein
VLVVLGHELLDRVWAELVECLSEKNVGHLADRWGESIGRDRRGQFLQPGTLFGSGRYLRDAVRIRKAGAPAGRLQAAEQLLPQREQRERSRRTVSPSAAAAGVAPSASATFAGSSIGRVGLVSTIFFVG